MTNTLRNSVLSLFVAGATFASACDCGCKDHKHEKAEAVVITGGDTMQFDVTAFEAKAGEEITVTFKNGGNLPKTAMGHNLVILKPGSDLAHSQWLRCLQRQQNTSHKMTRTRLS